MQEAMSLYVKDWRSAGDTSDDYINTWIELHEAHWDGIRRPAYPTLPLVPLFTHVVGATFKAGGYRTTKNYLSAHASVTWTWAPAGTSHWIWPVVGL